MIHILRILLEKFISHDLTNFKKLGSINSLILIFFYFHIMQLDNLNKLFNDNSLIM